EGAAGIFNDLLPLMLDGLLGEGAAGLVLEYRVEGLGEILRSLDQLVEGLEGIGQPSHGHKQRHPRRLKGIHGGEVKGARLEGVGQAEVNGSGAVLVLVAMEYLHRAV